MRTTDLTGKRSLASWMATGMLLSVALLSWFGYRATREWQRNSGLLLERRANDAADLLVTALARDMRGVEDSVLRSSRWNEAMLGPPYDIRILLGSAFARYPYPESFFGWRGEPDASKLIFFNREERSPMWASVSPGAARFPVTIAKAPSVAEQLVDRILKNRNRDGEFSVFDVQLQGSPYQVVTRLLYQDAFRERIVGGLGFTVNLDWLRHSYYPKLVNQVGRIADARDGLSLAIVDEHGERVAGDERLEFSRVLSTKTFPLLFVDPFLIWLDLPPDLSDRQWSVEVQSMNPQSALGATTVYTVGAILVAAIAGGAMALGLMLTSRAARASARVADMRSDFVATMTHELKTPLATLRAAGELVAMGRVGNPDTLRDYARIIVEESKRLTRLVDNSLAYARITDVTEVYHFEQLEVRELVDEALRGFNSQLVTKDFEVDVAIPDDLPAIRGDRGAIGMVLDNVIDNAVRYSRDARWLGVSAAQCNGGIRMTVSDHGIGIPPDEVPHVVRKFFRGRRAASGGSGLGLAIVSRIVGAHHGTLAIDTVAGSGTSVHITLPQADVNHEEAHSRS